MSTPPYLSVVMSVYNDADQLEKTIQSILNQSYGDFEFIIINDGSTDQSQSILEEFAEQDQRIKVISQVNNGLTRSLITGCEHAQGNYIARQDVGDFSYPTRFEKQINLLDVNEECVAVFSHFTLKDKNNQLLFTFRPTDQEIDSQLRPKMKNIASPSHHGSAMFKKRAYFQCAGYRSEFYFAQDLDLWIRLAELGKLRTVTEVLYDAQLTPDSISGTNHKFQKEMKKIIINSSHQRAESKDDKQLLKQALKIKPTKNKWLNKFHKSATLYFIGSCLQKQNPKAAKTYFSKAIAMNPINIKAWYKFLFVT